MNILASNFLLTFLSLAVVVVILILWLIALVSACTRKDLKNNRWLWILLIIFVGPIGQIIYFFSEDRKKLGTISLVTIILFPIFIIVLFSTLVFSGNKIPADRIDEREVVDEDVVLPQIEIGLVKKEKCIIPKDPGKTPILSFWTKTNTTVSVEQYPVGITYALGKTMLYGHLRFYKEDKPVALPLSIEATGKGSGQLTSRIWGDFALANTGEGDQPDTMHTLMFDSTRSLDYFYVSSSQPQTITFTLPVDEWVIAKDDNNPQNILSEDQKKLVEPLIVTCTIE